MDRLCRENSVTSTDNRPIALWLLATCVMIMAMVIVGGTTRLTGSGLSMVEWAPLMGWFPPTSQAEWQEVFAKYQQSPEYKLVNIGMDLEGFKGIFWLEFIHRVLGRLTGLVFLLPFLAFLAMKRLPKSLTPRLVGIFLLGGAQGLMGWYMVKSGLVNEPHVSQYRLAAHLGLAFLLYIWILWTALNLLADQAGKTVQRHPLAGKAAGLTIFTFITAMSGAFVAGLKAGLAYNTFPLMNGQIFPDDYFLLDPAWINMFDNVASVQWNHRLLAITTVILVVLFRLAAGRRGLVSSMGMRLNLLTGMAFVQLGLGIATLLMRVPVSLGVIHQAGALVLLTTAVIVTHGLYRGGR
ncbi:MAG: COX15/CtaA family protein [Magnetococcales bacterium]|nr:COX15/CtaA family protein [Magnetococcales bacterium]